MRYALISPAEASHDARGIVIKDAQRVVQVEAAPFPVAPPLRWIEVADGTVADAVHFDGAAIQAKPLPADDAEPVA